MEKGFHGKAGECTDAVSLLVALNTKLGCCSGTSLKVLYCGNHIDYYIYPLW